MVAVDTGNEGTIERADTKMNFGRSICRSASCRFGRVLNSHLRAQANSENDGVQHVKTVLMAFSSVVVSLFAVSSNAARQRSRRLSPYRQKSPAKSDSKGRLVWRIQGECAKIAPWGNGGVTISLTSQRIL